MRRNRRKNLDEGLDTKKMLYITGTVLALAVIAFVITFFIYGNTLNKNQQLSKINTDSLGTITAVEETSTTYGKTVEEMEQTDNENKNTDDAQKVAINTNSSKTKQNSVTNKNTTSNKNNSENKDKKETTNKTNKVNKQIETKTEKVADPEFKMPVSGEIMREFADNKLVYSNTLDVWTTHNGIDIVADKTTVVKSSADGKVTSIKNDPRYGLTIIIEHANGYKTVYANLLSTEFVVEGEQVKQGQSIGTVGSTAAFEITDEPHLHFELLKNNEQQDPELYLK